MERWKRNGQAGRHSYTSLDGTSSDKLGVALDLPAPHKMNNLIAIAGLHLGCDPLRPWKNLQVALNGHSVGGQAQVGKQRGNAKPFGHFARFSIHDNLDS
jgi:hypothetical protein